MMNKSVKPSCENFKLYIGCKCRCVVTYSSQYTQISTGVITGYEGRMVHLNTGESIPIRKIIVLEVPDSLKVFHARYKGLKGRLVSRRIAAYTEQEAVEALIALNIKPQYMKEDGK